MPKFFLVCLLPGLLSLTAYSQDSTLFRFHFRSGTEYKQVYTQKTKMTLTYDTSSKQVIKILEEKGVRNPTISTIESRIRSVTAAGSTGTPGSQSLAIGFREIYNPSLKADISAGAASMTGMVTNDSLPVLDTIVSKQLDANARNGIRSIMQNMYAQLRTPDKKMVPGGSSTRTWPLTIPVGGIYIDLLFTTTYKLLELSPDSARFNLAVTYTIPKKGKAGMQLPITGQGTGTGLLVYDRKNEFPVKWNMNNDLFFHIINPGFSMDLQLTGESSFDCVINGN